MKLRYKFVINEVAGEKVAVSTGDTVSRFAGYIKLNETGKFIFEMLQSDTQPDIITEAMKNAYKDAEESEIAETVNDFIEKLRAADLLEE